MGRGRQKAKQTKVARQLKYYSPETDYDALQRELATGNGHGREAALDDAEGSQDDGEVEEDDDEYADWPAPGTGR